MKKFGLVMVVLCLFLTPGTMVEGKSKKKTPKKTWKKKSKKKSNIKRKKSTGKKIRRTSTSQYREAESLYIKSKWKGLGSQEKKKLQKKYRSKKSLQRYLKKRWKGEMSRVRTLVKKHPKNWRTLLKKLFSKKSLKKTHLRKDRKKLARTKKKSTRRRKFSTRRKKKAAA